VGGAPWAWARCSRPGAIVKKRRRRSRVRFGRRMPSMGLDADDPPSRYNEQLDSSGDCTHGRCSRTRHVAARRLRAGRLALSGVVCLALAGPACSPKTYAIKMVADTLSEGTGGFTSDDDPNSSARRSRSASRPSRAWRSSCRSTGRCWARSRRASRPMRPASSSPRSAPRERRSRSCARQEGAGAPDVPRARDYGLRSLEVAYPNLRQTLMEDRRPPWRRR